jgi:hypothetical protein
MGDFYLLGGLQFTSVFVFGLPFSVAAMMREKPQHSTGWLLLAPGFGSTLYFSVGTLLHFLGLRAFSVFLGPRWNVDSRVNRAASFSEAAASAGLGSGDLGIFLRRRFSAGVEFC